jgi:hypothetical protein
MFMHHERLSLMAHRIYEDKALGQLRRVNTSFAFPSHLAPEFVSQGQPACTCAPSPRTPAGTPTRMVRLSLVSFKVTCVPALSRSCWPPSLVALRTTTLRILNDDTAA